MGLSTGALARGDQDVSDAPVGEGAKLATGTGSTDDAVEAWFTQTVAPAQGDLRPLRRRGTGRASPQSNPPTMDKVASSKPLDVLWPLLVVLGLIAASVVAFRRWVPRANRLGAGGVINILARHYLSPKQSLCLVRLGPRVLLIGVSPDRINAVAEIGDPEEAAVILSAVERSKPGSFSSMFARLTERDVENEVWGAEQECGVPLANGQLARAGADVRDLIRRIRALAMPPVGASRSEPSAEPT
ncbi:MAG: flagellar biosynthetic protein FliO [Phycisphaerae bacterium]|nr:flagellar biosynthetic protein FliO [Phycisphaerae bacterium]